MSEHTKEQLITALENSSTIFSEKLCSIRKKQKEAENLKFFAERDYWERVYNLFFDLRLEIEQGLNQKNLNVFCILTAYMQVEKRETAIAEAKKL